ncbi:hypothetical protein MC885_015615 [Smutsia gigantea]|nr:hypothetical protein MC885_015615 [Smutsia gigantea]
MTAISVAAAQQSCFQCNNVLEKPMFGACPVKMAVVDPLVVAQLLYLFKLGIAPQIQDLLGKVDFTVHAAVIAINEAIEKGVAEQTIITLRNPNAVLTSVDDSLAQEYQKELWEAKKRKEETARLKNNCVSEEERDVYEELLTQAEIQGNINKVNRLAAVDHINAVIREGDPENTLLALKKPEAQLPAVYPFAAVMYQDELFNLQKQSAMNYLAHEELLIAVEMLSAVALLNQALDSHDLVSVQNQLRGPTTGFNNLDEAYVERYANALLSVKLEALSQGQVNLSWNEIQNSIDMVNTEIQEENDLPTIEISLLMSIRAAMSAKTYLFCAEQLYCHSHS